MFHVEQCVEALTGAGLELPPSSVEKAVTFLDLMYRWNRTHDLTAVTADQAVERHLVDSLLPFREAEKPSSLLDVGSGAGLPGIPLALLWPGCAVTLNEPLKKRRAFLEHVCAELDLEAEVNGDPVERLEAGPFELVVSRATMAWPKLLRASVPLLGMDGRVAAMLGPTDRPTEAELAALGTGDDWERTEVVGYTLPSGAERLVLWAWSGN